jgi:hypothetical protein
LLYRKYRHGLVLGWKIITLNMASVLVPATIAVYSNFYY